MVDFKSAKENDMLYGPLDKLPNAEKYLDLMQMKINMILDIN